MNTPARFALACVTTLIAVTAHGAGAADLPVLDKDPNLQQCNFALINRSCYLNIGVPDATVVPSIRIKSSKSSKVELRVFRSPFNQVEFDIVSTLQAEPDVPLALIKQWIEPLKGFVGSVDLLAIPVSAAKNKNQVELMNFMTNTRQNFKINDLCTLYVPSICKLLLDIDDKQLASQKSLGRWSNQMDGVVILLGDLKKMKDWVAPNDSSSVDPAFKAKVDPLKVALGSDASLQPCDTAGISPVRCTLPTAAISSLKDQLILAKQIFSAETPTGSELYLSTVQELALLTDRQISLEAALANAKMAQDKLAAVGDKLKDFNDDEGLRPVAVHTINSPKATASTQVKITVTNLWSAKSTAPTAPSILWGTQSWEVSIGLVVSKMKKRTFGVAPILDANGEPTLGGADGKTQINHITRSATSPTVFPALYASYRLGSEFPSGKRRSAFFLTLGVGTNDSTAEGFAGLSYSYGSAVLSIGGQYGRENKLDEALKDKDTTTIASGDLANFQSKHWGWHPALSLSYRVPIT